MELLALRWVLLAGTLLSTSDTSSALREGDLGPITVPMDMADESFDDQYKGCEDMMRAWLQMVNHTEIAANSIYAAAWKNASAEWQKRCRLPTDCPQLRQEQAMAVLAYSAAGGMCELFNAATRQGGLSHQYYMQSYHFKTLHFLLTQVLRALRGSDPKKCYHVYRGVRGIRFTARRGMAVRFGQFTSTSQQKDEAKKFGRDTFFVMKTCYGVPIKQLSFFEYEDEVLIPPFEVFEVTKFTRIDSRTEIHLRSKRTESRYNCELLKRLGGQWGRGHQEVGLGLSPGLDLHSLPCPRRGSGGSGHREGDPIPAAL